MKIKTYVDAAVIVEPENDEERNGASDFARQAYEEIAKRHNLPLKPQEVVRDVSGEVSVYTNEKTKKQV